MWMDVRSTYLSAVDIAIDLLDDPDVEAAWSIESALSGWRVSGLCGHLARAVITVEQYLDADPAPRGKLLSAGGYYAAVIDTNDLDSELHRTIRARGDEMASGGAASLLQTVLSSATRLRDRLPSEPEDRQVAVLAGTVLRLDEYLATRLVELVVHADDVAVSVGIATPTFPAEAYRIVIETLLDVSLRRFGDLAVIRALARRERDEVEALRVF
jgi:hypothetical protein